MGAVDSEAVDPPPFPADVPYTVSVSGGGYRAALFSAGALLALADSAARPHIASVSSVSGGSIASAMTVGGFNDATDDNPDPMAHRVRLIAGLAQTNLIDTQALLLASIKMFGGLVAAALVIAFVFPAWDLSQEDPDVATNTVYVGRVISVIVLLLLLLGIGWVVHAFQTSLYAVQSVIESLMSEVLRTGDTTGGTALSDIDGAEGTRRIFCATDLSLGSHVYLTPGRVLAAGSTGREPRIFLADVVAASACFPGFRPIVFTRTELGLEPLPPTAPPRVHRSGGRLLLGILGMLGLASVVVAVILRMLSPYLGQGIGVWPIVMLLVAGAAAVVLSARLLVLRDRLVLVDGGVCDNLGAAFTLLAQDARYSDLPAVSGTGNGGVMLVVDASKPFGELDLKSHSITSFLPLRIRGAQRSVIQLLGNANAVARKQAIRLLLQGGNPLPGDVVSIQDAPTMLAGSGPQLAARNAATPTTLAALDAQTVRGLLVQSYRLTEQHLARRGIPSLRQRTDADFDALVEAEGARHVQSVVAKGRGPYSRAKRRKARTVTAVVVLGGPLLFLAITLLTGMV